MTLSIPPGFAHIALEHRHDLDPDPWFVTYGADVSEAGGDTTEIGQDAIASYFTAWHLALSDSVSVTGCQVTLGQDGAESVRAFVVGTGDVRGDSTQEKLPRARFPIRNR